ncbi:MAG: hypothetical protein PHT77_05425 [Bacteroidales bacterium]|nr:hypothetical protein [Bacteroidales bacterium]
MTNWSIIGYDCKRDIEESLEVENIEHIRERITTIQKELAELMPVLESRKEHIKKHIVRKYCINVWKHNSTYRDTDETFEKYSILNETKGSHYSVSVYEYIYDTSLIGTKEKSRIEEDKTVITIPHLKYSHDGYSEQLSRSFSWKKKDLALKYASMLCEKYGLTLKPASEFSDIMNDSCLFVTGMNNCVDVWNGN